MTAKEATAQIKINRLLDEAGWRFFDDAKGKANVVLEHNVKLTEAHLNALGDDLEKSASGFIDFLLLDDFGKPLVVLEAKSQSKAAKASVPRTVMIDATYLKAHRTAISLRSKREGQVNKGVV